MDRLCHNSKTAAKRNRYTTGCGRECMRDRKELRKFVHAAPLAAAYG